MGTPLAPLRVTRDNLVPLPVLGLYFIMGLTAFAAAPLLLWHAAPALEAGAYRHPSILAAVHLYTLGWGTGIAMGALQQLSPVLAASRLHSYRLARWGFAALAAGLLALLAGFFTFHRGAFVGAAVLLPLGVALPLLNALLTQRLAPMTRQGLFVRPFVGAAAAYLLLTAGAGAALATHLGSGWLGTAWLHAFGPHVTFGLGGWFLMLVLGVSYHMLRFFGLTDKKRPPRAITVVRRLIHAGIGLSIVAVTMPASASGPMARLGLALALALPAVAMAVFVWEHRDLCHPKAPERMHPIVGYIRAAHLYLAAVAVLLIAVAVRLLTAFLSASVSGSFAGGAGNALEAVPPAAVSPATVVFVGVLALTGWLSNTILGYLHRIVPFVVWHNKYWDRSREPGIPAFRVMVDTRVAWIGFALYNGGVLAVLAGLVTPLPVAPGLALLTVGGAIAAANLLRVFLR